MLQCEYVALLLSQRGALIGARTSRRPVSSCAALLVCSASFSLRLPMGSGRAGDTGLTAISACGGG